MLPRKQKHADHLLPVLYAQRPVLGHESHNGIFVLRKGLLTFQTGEIPPDFPNQVHPGRKIRTFAVLNFRGPRFVLAYARPLRVREGIGLPDPAQQLRVQLLPAADDKMVGPAAGIGLRFHRDARRVQRRGQAKRQGQPALRQLGPALDAGKGNAGEDVSVEKADLRLHHPFPDRGEGAVQQFLQRQIQLQRVSVSVKKQQRIRIRGFHAVHAQPPSFQHSARRFRDRSILHSSQPQPPLSGPAAPELYRVRNSMLISRSSLRPSI